MKPKTQSGLRGIIGDERGQKGTDQKKDEIKLKKPVSRIFPEEMREKCEKKPCKSCSPDSTGNTNQEFTDMDSILKELDRCGDILTKEQMRIVCHISKRKAMYLLQSGLVPCINTGKKTHTYLIRKSDVRQYVLERDVYPWKYKCGAPALKRKAEPHLLELIPESRMREYYEEKLSDYPDVMTVEQIYDFIGYGSETVYSWTRKGELKYLNCLAGYRFPKTYLLRFLCSDYCNRISRKTEKHLTYLTEMIGRSANLKMNG